MVKTPVITKPMTRIIPTMSTGIFSVANKTTATKSKINVIAIGDIVRNDTEVSSV
jgi:hypothetical protein